MADKTLDCKNLRCPMPIVMLSREVKEMAAGDTIEIIADDPAFQIDVRAWCKRTGNELQSFLEEGETLQALIRIA